MADPFSIAASVAGILSLGIESCKLIVKYCDDFHGADEQIDSIALKAGGLLSTLQEIDTLLKVSDGVHPKIASDIREKVLQNETWINKINERVARLSIVTSGNGLSDKLRATAKKAAYPLKKDSLADTVEVLQGLQMNLHTALLTLQIQHASALSKQTELIKEVKSLVVVQSGQLGLDMARMELAIRDSSETSQQHQVLRDRKTQGTNGRPTSSMPCICSNNVTPFGREMAIRRSCARHKHSMRTKTRSKKLILGSSWFGFSIEAAISISRRANGLSITPTLNFHAIVPDDSPAFKLVRSSQWQDATPEDTATHFNRVVQELQRLFDQGRATPFDRTADGETLLHAAAFDYFFFGFCRFESCRAPAWNLMKYLVEIGCPVNETDAVGGLAINEAIKHADDAEIHVSRFLTLGAVLMDSSVQGLKGIKTVEYLWSHNREAFVVSDVTEAVLLHSEDMLKQQLELNKDDHQKPSELYELCFYWADGIRVLHEAGCEIPTFEKKYLLICAVLNDLTEAARALVDIGAVADSRLIAASKSKPMNGILTQDLIVKGEHLLTLAKALPPHVQVKLELQNGHLPDQKAHCIVLELESRGFSIDPWFRHYNEEPVFGAFALQADQMERLYQAGFRDVDTPDSRGYTPLMQFIVNFSYPFYLSNDLRNTLERLRWLVDKGASLDVICQSNKLPARIIVILNIAGIMILFFAEKPFFNEPFDDYWDDEYDGWNVDWDTELAEARSLLTSHSAFLQRILESGSTNETPCFCSVSRGSLLSMALCFAIKYALHRQYGSSRARKRFRMSLSLFCEAFLTEIPVGPQVADDIIRLLTFTDLELTHTCYRIKRGWLPPILIPFDEEDSVEIHDEERHMIEELESLVVEFQREYEALGIPLWEYIQTHWCDRMSEYLEKHGESVTDTSMCSILRPSVLET